MRQRVRFSSAAAIGAVVSVTIAGVALSALTGPSTAQSPYVLPAAPGVETTSLLSVYEAQSQANESTGEAAKNTWFVPNTPRGAVFQFTLQTSDSAAVAG